jgi:hypothetical protein
LGGGCSGFEHGSVIITGKFYYGGGKILIISGTHKSSFLFCRCGFNWYAEKCPSSEGIEDGLRI